MPGFGDLPVGDTSVFGGATAAPAPAPRPQGGGGIGGFLFKNLIQPTVKSVGGAISDIPKIGSSIGFLGKAAAAGATGNQKALKNATDRQKQLLQGTSFNQKFLDPNLEKAAGKTTGQILNLTAPVAGAEATGVKAAAGLGLKLGAAGGAANSMAQGKSGGDVINSAIEGGATGAVTGAAGGVLGKGLSKLAGGKVPQVASKPSLVNRAATGKAQNSFNQEMLQNFGNPGTDTAGINPIVKEMQGHGLQPNIPHMAAYADASKAIEAVKTHMLDNYAAPVKVDINQIIDNAIKSQPGIGRDTRTVTSALRSMLNDTLNPTGNISGKYSPQAVYEATKALYNAKSANPAVSKAFMDARSSLTNVLNNEAGLSSAISEYKLPSVTEAKVNGAAATDPTAGGHALKILEAAGGNESLANSIIDKLNGAKSFQDLQKAQLPHIRASEIAQSATDAINGAMPKTEKAGGGGFGELAPVYEAASLAHGNVAAAAPLAARAARSGPIQGMLAKMGTPNMSEVGPRVAPEIGPGAGEVVPGDAAPGMPGEMPAAPPDTEAPGQIQSIFPPGVKQGIINAPGNAVNAVRGAMQPTPSNISSLVGGVTGVAAANSQPTVSAMSGGDQAPAPTDVASSGNLASGLLSGGDQAPPDQGASSSYPEANMMADVQRDPAHASTYEALYKTLNPASAQKTLTTNQQNTITSLRGAIGGLTPYSQQLQGVSNAGPAGGRIESLMGSVGLGGENAAAIHALDTSRTEIATQIAKALTGSKPAATIVRSWENAIPSVTDTPAVRQEKWNMLAQRLQGELSQVTQPMGNPDATTQLLDQLQTSGATAGGQ